MKLLSKACFLPVRCFHRYSTSCRRRPSKRVTVPPDEQKREDRVKESDEQAIEAKPTEVPLPPTEPSQPSEPVQATEPPGMDLDETEQICVDEGEQAGTGEVEKFGADEAEQAVVDEVPVTSGDDAAQHAPEYPEQDEDESSREPAKEPGLASDADLQPLLLQMVCADDLRGAYWFARSWRLAAAGLRIHRGSSQRYRALSGSLATIRR